MIGKYQGKVQPVLETGKIPFNVIYKFVDLLNDSRDAIMTRGSEAYSAYLVALRHLRSGLNGSARISGVSEAERAGALKKSLDSQFATIHARFYRDRTYEVNRRRNLN